MTIKKYRGIFFFFCKILKNIRIFYKGEIDVASITSLSNSASSSMISGLYNSGNILSGLASGLDTESMIENLVKSYQTKIQTLTNKATKIEWKQEAYRSIINKMYAFSSKYASYSSATNLMSPSFFSSAIKVAAMGANQAKVSATGRTDSDIKINSVKQLATAARFNTQSNLNGTNADFTISAEKAVNLAEEFDTGALNGSLSLKYGSNTVSVVFDPSTDIIEDYVYKTNEDGSYMLNSKGKRIVERERTSEEKAADLQKLIEKKLGDSTITLSNGESKKASELISVKLDGSSITFADKSTGGNDVYIASASDSVSKTLGLDLEDASKTKPDSFSIGKNTKFVNTKDLASTISGAKMNISLDGKTKSIRLPTIRSTENGGYEVEGADGKYSALTGSSYAAAVQAALDKEFGVGKIKVGSASDAANSLQLSFTAPDSSDLIINTDVGEALGIGNVATNYLNTSSTLGKLMKEDAWDGLEAAKGTGAITRKDGKWYDANGKEVDDKGYLLDSSGNKMYAFKINGVTIGNYSKDTKLSTIMNDINSNSAAGVKVSYSQTTRQFSFVSKDTGSAYGIELGDGLAQKMFGAAGSGNSNFAKAFGVTPGENGTSISFKNSDGYEFSTTIQKGTTINDVVSELNDSMMFKDLGYTASYHKTSGQIIVTDETGKKVDLKMSADGKELKSGSTSSYNPGQDAVFTVEVNGQELEMTRSSNTTTIDGLTLTFKDTFNKDYVTGGELETEAVTFQQSTDSDKIVDAIKSMVFDYNEMMSEIKSTYSTMPYQSNGKFQRYEPLSDEDRATMSESAIQDYEAKAKQGILFNDYNLSSLYTRMREAFNFSGADANTLKDMGISWTFTSDNVANLTLDENKLREKLDSDPDAVADLFTRSADAGGTSNGIMQNMKTQLDRYGSTTGAVKGILVEQAGTPLSSLSLLNNTWQSQIDAIGKQIEKWQDKLSAQVDKYTKMFSRLESLIGEMNSQSATLAGLMGGSSGGY